MAGQAHHFRIYALEKQPYAIERYTNEVARLYGSFEWTREDIIKSLRAFAGFISS